MCQAPRAAQALSGHWECSSSLNNTGRALTALETKLCLVLSFADHHRWSNMQRPPNKEPTVRASHALLWGLSSMSTGSENRKTHIDTAASEVSSAPQAVNSTPKMPPSTRMLFRHPDRPALFPLAQCHVSPGALGHAVYAHQSAVTWGPVRVQ